MTRSLEEINADIRRNRRAFMMGAILMGLYILAVTGAMWAIIAYSIGVPL